MKFILVLQWPGTSEADYNTLLETEEKLEVALDGHSDVDGHDFGSGEMSIFVKTDDPNLALIQVKSLLGESDTWNNLRAAYRAADGEAYTVIWPRSVSGFSVK
ncbi:hypothetical protein ACIA03_22860 [Nocardioides sp. NPDC051685]|uniref:hypothetical protein n=1 Tax=Nocardioides sp. NPDC051685 TaxID=3364334 RepID=UPI0037B553F3